MGRISDTFPVPHIVRCGAYLRRHRQPPREGRKDQPSILPLVVGASHRLAATRPCLPTAVLPRSFISSDRWETWLMIRRISERVSIVLNASAIAAAPER